MRSVKQICTKNLTVSSGSVRRPGGLGQVSRWYRNGLRLSSPASRRLGRNTIGCGADRISRAKRELVKTHIDSSGVRASTLTRKAAEKSFPSTHCSVAIWDHGPRTLRAFFNLDSGKYQTDKRTSRKLGPIYIPQNGKLDPTALCSEVSECLQSAEKRVIKRPFISTERIALQMI
jgi:hypothetical protein